MHNPFTEVVDESTDADLIEQAKHGSREALEKLVLRHQAWIYNIAVRMVFHSQDAEEVTQEVLIKAITRLSTFQGESQFRTWLYRITANHVLNMKRRGGETEAQTFSSYADAINDTPDLDLPDPKTVPVDVPLLVEEAKISCTTGMLLCLDRKQRLIFTLGEIFGASDTVGSEILEMTADNFRQSLARARRDLYQFMHGQCGLVNANNSCRCPKKTRGFIGAGIANELAAGGAAVVVNYASDRTGAEAAVEAIVAAGGRATAIQADVSKAADVARLFEQAQKAFGPLDILVNNAGVYQAMPVAELTETEFHREININLLGPLLVIRESLKYFGPNGGSIINIGSGASRSYPPGYSIYSASKAGLDAVTGVLAKELAPRKIRVNSVNPGATLSEGTKTAGLYGVGSDIEQHLVAMTPLGRMGTPEDIAKVVAFLASDDSGWLTGEVILASGGLR